MLAMSVHVVGGKSTLIPYGSYQVEKQETAQEDTQKGSCGSDGYAKEEKGKVIISIVSFSTW